MAAHFLISAESWRRSLLLDKFNASGMLCDNDWHVSLSSLPPNRTILYPSAESFFPSSIKYSGSHFFVKCLAPGAIPIHLCSSDIRWEGLQFVKRSGPSPSS
jgi:hypothetical protein